MSWDMYPDAAVEYLLEKGPPADWSIVEEEGVDLAIHRAADAVMRQYPAGLERDDLVQEGWIIAATKPDEARRTLKQGIGAFYQFVWRDLTDMVKTSGKRREKNVSREQLVAGAMREEGAGV